MTASDKSAPSPTADASSDMPSRRTAALSGALSLYRRILPTEVRANMPEFLRRALKRTLGIKDPLVRVQELRVRLNALGFIEQALDDLVAMVESQQPVERQLALWDLAVWHANRRSPEGSAEALALLNRGLQDIMHPELRRREAILRAECHATLGEIQAGRTVLMQALQDAQHPDLHLATANLCTDSGERIFHVNRALALFDLPLLSMRPDGGEPFYDRLMVAAALRAADGPKITVIVPAFNAADHIGTALNALVKQTWQNFEVLVVDDLSTDDTATVVAAYSERDPRIKLIQAEVNRGSYASRNIALGEATGEFVTTHDSDDWSHPMKLELQARSLIERPNLMANMSQQARATNELLFHRRGNPGHYIFDNMSSLMFRREAVLQRLGCWDSVRFGADSEFIERIRLTFGRRSVASLTDAGPLSFQRQSESSLTGSSVFGFHGFFMGARLSYHQASRRYHRKAKRLRYEFPQETRPFAVPEPMWPAREVVKGEQRRFDTVLVADFRLRKKAARIRAQIEEERCQGHRVALVQMAVYAADPNGQILPTFRDLEDRGAIHFVVAGERVKCERLLVLQPHVLEHFQRFIPEVKAERVEVSVNEIPAGISTPEAAKKWLASCKKNAERLFGAHSTWDVEDKTFAALVGDAHAKGTDSKV